MAGNLAQLALEGMLDPTHGVVVVGRERGREIRPSSLHYQEMGWPFPFFHLAINVSFPSCYLFSRLWAHFQGKHTGMAPVGMLKRTGISALGSAGTLGPLRDKLVLSALLNVFLLNKAVGNARTICGYPLTLGTGEAILVGSGASISHLHSRASNVFTLGRQNCSSGLAPGDQLHVLSRQDQVTFSLADFYTFLSLRCVLKAISPCFIEWKYRENGVWARVLFSLYTLCMKQVWICFTTLGCRKCHSIEISSKPSFTKRMRWAILGIIGMLLPSFPGTVLRHLRKGLQSSVHCGSFEFLLESPGCLPACCGPCVGICLTWHKMLAQTLLRWRHWRQHHLENAHPSAVSSSASGAASCGYMWELP